MVRGVGALALSRKNVLIRQLSTAETLGDVTTIVTDKNGRVFCGKESQSKFFRCLENQRR